MNLREILTLDNIFTLDFDKFKNISLCDDFYKTPGDQHYRLLSYLSSLFNNVNIIEIGTHVGESAIALSYNENNNVYTFDIIDKISSDKKVRQNIKYIIDDVMTNDSLRDKWKSIFIYF